MTFAVSASLTCVGSFVDCSSDWLLLAVAVTVAVNITVGVCSD